MPKAEFFSRVGLFVDKNCLDLERCAQLRAEMAASSDTEMAGVTTAGVDAVRVSRRSTRKVSVSESTKTFIKTRLKEYIPTLSHHYGVPLQGPENPQFLIYREGDFFHVHTDSDTSRDAHEYARNRCVSAVLFLNGASVMPQEDWYTGGSLTLYNLLKGPMWEGKGFELEGEPGLLFTFRSDVPHEVLPVTSGERYTIVAWYHAA